MKQTAVEWLLDNLISEPYSEEDFNHNSAMWDKAKEMEKKHIINARLSLDQSIHFSYALYKAEEYYNETFKNK